MSLIQFFSTAFLRAVLEFTVWYIEQQIQTTMQSMWHTMGEQAWADLDIVYTACWTIPPIITKGGKF